MERPAVSDFTAGRPIRTEVRDGVHCRHSISQPRHHSGGFEEVKRSVDFVSWKEFDPIAVAEWTTRVSIKRRIVITIWNRSNLKFVYSRLQIAPADVCIAVFIRLLFAKRVTERCHQRQTKVALCRGAEIAVECLDAHTRRAKSDVKSEFRGTGT